MIQWRIWSYWKQENNNYKYHGMVCINMDCLWLWYLMQIELLSVEWDFVVCEDWRWRKWNWLVGALQMLLWHRVATSTCHGHVDEFATEPFLSLHREHETGYWRSRNCCNWRIRFVVIWKHFCFILSTGTRIRIDSVMHPRSSSRGHNASALVTVTVTATA